MVQASLSGMKGSTKDIVLALYTNANPQLADVMSPAEIQNTALSDMLLARAASMMLKAPELLQSLDANIKSIVAGNAKIPAALVKQSETVQQQFRNHENTRGSLEKKLIEHADSFRAKAREIIQDMLSGNITRDVAVDKLTKLNNDTAEHLRTKIEATTKESNLIKDAQTKTLEEIYKTIPGKNISDLQKILNPEDSTPRLDS